MAAMGGSSAVLFFVLACVLVPGAMSGTFVFTNKCSEDIYPGVLTATGRTAFPTTGFELKASGGSATYDGVPADWSGRLWARHRCSTDGSGRFSCESGDCGSGKVECAGAGGVAPVTLAEFTLGSSSDGKDFYDVSNVDGFNVPMQVEPAGGSGCTTVSCAADINGSCPDDLAQKGADGSTVGCKSGCLAYNTDELCCRGDFGNPDKCKPSTYSTYFKDKCPQAYSYAYDDKSSTFTCTGGSYNIVFCP